MKKIFVAAMMVIAACLSSEARASVVLDNFSLATITTNGNSAGAVTRTVTTVGGGLVKPPVQATMQFQSGADSLTLTYTNALGSVAPLNNAVLEFDPELYIQSNVAGITFTLSISAQLKSAGVTVDSLSHTESTSSGSWVTVGNAFNFTNTAGFAFDEVVVTLAVDAGSAISGWFNLNDLGNGGQLRILEATPPPPPPPGIPEPTSMAMLALGLAGIGGVRRLRRKS